MEIIIAGTRFDRHGKPIKPWLAYAMVAEAIQESGFTGITAVHSGGALEGIDQAGEEWAWAHNIEPQIHRPEYYKVPGDKYAPLLRNQKMVDLMKARGGALLAVWNGTSRGTQDIIDRAKTAGIPCYVKRCRL